MMKANVVQEAIEELQSRKQAKQEQVRKIENEIHSIEEQIERMKLHPEQEIMLKEIMKHLKEEPDYLKSGKTLWTALNHLERGYGVGVHQKIKTLFEVSLMTEPELRRRRGIGEEMVEEIKLLLNSYGLSLKQQ